MSTSIEWADALSGFTEAVPFRKAELGAATDGPGVHVVWAEDGTPLYVGQTSRLRGRMLDHLRGDRDGSSLHSHIVDMLDQPGAPTRGDDVRSYLGSCKVAWREFDDPPRLKRELIASLRPRFNVDQRSSAEDTGTQWAELPALIEAVLEALRDRQRPESVDAYRPIVQEAMPAAVAAAVAGSVEVRGRVGTGDIADVPWVGLFPRGAASAKDGVYVVLLFSYDGSRCYLSLNQGSENLRGGAAVLRKRSLDLRDLLPSVTGLNQSIDRGSSNQRPRLYEAGNAWAKTYRAGSIPDAETLRDDLEQMVDLLEFALAQGVGRWGDVEPVHLVLKWSAELDAATLGDHAAVARTKGSVWWGKLGDPSTSAIGGPRRKLLQQQLDMGISTHCFLYRKGEAWRAEVIAFTSDPDEVDRDLLPGRHGTAACNLFVHLRGFVELAPEWPVANLVLMADPDPGTIAGALSNQRSPVFVYERLDAQHHDEPEPVDATPIDELTATWLSEQVHWPVEAVDELVSLVDERPQIILAGPPGTGKTWLAKHLARLLTNDAPLAHRVLQLHPSYGYEEFVQGLRPVSDEGLISFRVVDGAVLQMVEQIEETTDQRHVLILDEMNRANLPKVLGELMHLLEYRDESVDLMYSRDFSLPSTLIFIGTMNTADRSIRSIDVALRRRFEIVECPPDRSVLERFYRSAVNEVPDLLEGFDELNRKLTDELDRHHTIGHSFFMTDPMTPDRLRNTWRRQLAPLIDEYFFDRPATAATFRIEELWPSLSSPSA